MGEALIYILFYPPVMGYLATTKGYRFWTWFFIGLLVPFVSIFILMAKKDISQEIDPSKLIIHQHNDKILYTRESTKSENPQ